MRAKHILVAPLDWGLGHATRCIPIIEHLLERGCVVSIASSGDAFALLKKEFPDLGFFSLPSYAAVYSQRLPLMIKVFLQLPKFLWVIEKERKVLRGLVATNSFDAILSDNRYGCRHPDVYSVFIGHQLNIIMPSWLAWFAPVVNWMNHRWISRFDSNWIPDDPDYSLSGKLSRPPLPNSKWIGILSRFKRHSEPIHHYRVAVVLSGPEPQRSIFEKLALDHLVELNIKAILVRGQMHGEDLEVSPKIKIVSYLGGDKLQKVIESADVVVCRSGYSSIMDLSILGKMAILVPTPGQTEQEYLASELMKRGIAFCQLQQEFDLERALVRTKDYSGFVGRASRPNLLAESVDEIIR